VNRKIRRVRRPVISVSPVNQAVVGCGPFRIDLLKNSILGQCRDPDSKVTGITSFKLENKEMLESVLVTLANKADMTLRGDIYVKKKAEDSSKATPQ
jgi:hypothetical protein